MKPFRFKIVKRSMKVDLPSFPSSEAENQPEQLTGNVQGMTASAPEERMARALDKAGIQYLFRYVVGAPKGLPGWKELDFLITSGGQLHPVEVDTAFTHRNKQNADILHDAIILNDSGIRAMGEVYPQVRHVDGDADLDTMEHAQRYVKQNFIKSSYVGRANEFETPQYETVVVAAPPQDQAPVESGSNNKKKPKQIVNNQKVVAQRKSNVQIGQKSVTRKVERYDK